MPQPERQFSKNAGTDLSMGTAYPDRFPFVSGSAFEIDSQSNSAFTIPSSQQRTEVPGQNRVTFRRQGNTHRHLKKYKPVATAKRQTILLIVQEDRLCTMLRQLLRTEGYAVIAVATVEEATKATAGIPIALALLHFAPTMTYGGWESYTHLRTHLAAPVMALSGLAAEQWITANDSNASGKTHSELPTSIQNYLDCIKLLLQTPKG
jgi:CheY-like chemotaxis protein